MNIMFKKFERAKTFKQENGYEKFFLQISNQRPICIFGCGLLGREICSWLIGSGIRPACFCDNNPTLHGETVFEDIPCISFEDLLKNKENMYVIVGIGDLNANQAINIQLKDFKYVMRNPLGITAYWHQTFDISGEEFESGFSYGLKHLEDEDSKELYTILANLRLQDHVEDYSTDILSKYYRKCQYIVKDIIDYSKIKTYLDCGAYDGDSLREFIRLGTDASYHCFEMDRIIFEKLKNNANKYKGKNIKLYSYGVGGTSTEAFYVPDSTGGSKISRHGVESAQIVALDSIDFGEKIDFLKMDIEGAEESAILGAKDLVKRVHPILAISIYHNFSQFVNIAKMIKDIDPQYRIYIRQHKYTMDDTVCYAI